MTVASLLSLALIAIGGAMISYAMRMTSKARESLSWPSTDGEIAHSAVFFQTDTSTTASRVGTDKAAVSYRYQVKGVNYSSSQIILLDFSSTAARAERLVKNYPDKSTVCVYYNPSNCSESVLEPGVAGGINLLVSLGALCAMAGFSFLIMSLTGHAHPTH